MDYFYLILFVSVGLFNVIAAIFNWEWYFKSLQGQKRWHYSNKRVGIRILYALLGIAVILFGIIVYT